MNEEWVNQFLEILAEDEGTEGRKVALEGGVGTRGYGITHIADGLKNFLSFNKLNAEEMSDKDLAKQIVLYNIEQMKKDIGEDTWNNLPNSMKIVASDQYYNSGKLFNGFKGDLINGNYESALKNTLDIISANDPATGTNAVMNGLINRRIRNYNRAANDLGFSQITNYTVGDSLVEGKKTAVTYSYNNGDPFVVNTSGSMHSQSLKKNDTSLIDNQLKADALRMDGSLPEVMMNPYIDDEAKTEILKTETENVFSVDNITNTVGNFVEGVREYNTQAEKQAAQIPELIEGYKEIDKETEAMGQKFETDSAKDFINNIEPPQLWNLDYATPYDKEDLDQIANVTYKRQQDLKKKYTLGEATKSAYEDEMIATNLYKQFSREDLAPDPNFVLTSELIDELMVDLPQDYMEEFAHAHSLAHAQQIREQLLKHLTLEDKINSQGVGKGTMLRLLAAFTDPAAWTAIVATDGLLAPIVALQKSARAYRILRKAGAGAVSIGAIETYLASQRPDLDIDNVMHGVMTGAFLGGLFGIRRPRIKSNDFTKTFKNTMDESDTKLIRDDGGFEPPTGNNSNLVPGPNNPNPVKPNGERTFDWYDPNYDLALHTTKRPDGRFEVRMIENQSGKPDELIMQVNKDGTVEVRKCKLWQKKYVIGMKQNQKVLLTVKLQLMSMLEVEWQSLIFFVTLI